MENKNGWKKCTTKLEINGSIFHKLLLHTNNKSTNATSPQVMTLSSCKSDLFRAIIHFSCIYPLIQRSLLVMPNISRQRNRKYIKT